MKKSIVLIFALFAILTCTSCKNDKEDLSNKTYSELTEMRLDIRKSVEEKESTMTSELLELKVVENERYWGGTIYVINNALEAQFKDFVIVRKYLSATKTIIQSDTVTKYLLINPQDTVSIQYEFEPEDDFQFCNFELLNATYVPNEDLK